MSSSYALAGSTVAGSSPKSDPTDAQQACTTPTMPGSAARQPLGPTSALSRGTGAHLRKLREGLETGTAPLPSASADLAASVLRTPVTRTPGSKGARYLSPTKSSRARKAGDHVAPPTSTGFDTRVTAAGPTREGSRNYSHTSPPKVAKTLPGTSQRSKRRYDEVKGPSATISPGRAASRTTKRNVHKKACISGAGTGAGSLIHTVNAKADQGNNAVQPPELMLKDASAQPAVGAGAAPQTNQQQENTGPGQEQVEEGSMGDQKGATAANDSAFPDLTNMTPAEFTAAFDNDSEQASDNRKRALAVFQAMVRQAAS